MSLAPVILGEFPDPQVILVIIMVVFAGIKALLEKIKGEEYDPDLDPEQHPEDLEALYQEQLREQREMILRRQQKGLSPPPLPDPPVKIPEPTPEPTPATREVVRQPVLSAAEKQALANLKKASSMPTRATSPPLGTARTRARRVLSSPYAARDAIVLSEILGKPKSLR
ncbi:hypothetical protein N9Z02_01385 [Akkermansiaceae bacterium]|nr:hypothetical protein [Akkermansiaceae bacterium]